MKSLLENYGITFGYKGDSVFDQSRDLVIIRNTEDQHDLLDFLMQSLIVKSESETWRKDREMRLSRGFHVHIFHICEQQDAKLIYSLFISKQTAYMLL